MVCDENLSKFLVNKNLNTLYMDFLGQKILILNSYNPKTKREILSFLDLRMIKYLNLKKLNLNPFP